MRILLADDHPLFREGVKPVLERLDTQVEILEAKDFPSAFAITRKARDLDLALLDLHMPGMGDLEGILRFRSTYPTVPVVVLSAAEDAADIQRVMAAGVLGYLTKSTPSEEILHALRDVLAGGIYLPPVLEDGRYPPLTRFGNPLSRLSERQRQVVSGLARGLSNREIGEELELAEGTIKLHMSAIFRILRVGNRTEALLVAQKMGLHRKK